MKSILVVAPHLMLPTHMGHDIYIEKIARHLSCHSRFVDLVCCQAIRRYRNGEIESEVLYSNQMRGKIFACIRTLFLRTHYLHERIITPSVLRVIQNQVEKEAYGIVLASYLVTLVCLLNSGKKFAVFTHNDEFKMYMDIAQQSANPLVHLVAKQSLGWLRREISRLAQVSVFLHISSNDRDGYERALPGHKCLITGVGTDLDESPQWGSAPLDAPVILSFVGSLGVQMAVDALNNFYIHFYPQLHSAFGPRLKVRIVGSQPGTAIQKLCQTAGWELHKDVSDFVLSQLLCESTFTILPFSYSNGVKLKLLRSLGSGTPFLSTTVSRPPNFATPLGCCFSDNVEDWTAAIRFWLSQPDRFAMRQRLYDQAKANSWPRIVDRLANALFVSLRDSVS